MAQLEIPVEAAVGRRAGVSHWLRGLRQFVRGETVGAISALVLLLTVVAVLVGPALVSYDPIKINIQDKFLSPKIGSAHLLGTDQLGRDVLSRVLTGGRVSLGTSLGALVLGLGAASFLGIMAGYFAHWSTQVLQRFMDGMMSLPPLILALAIATALGSSIFNVLLAVSIVMLPSIFRVVRAATLTVRNADYVIAATVVGSSSLRIILRHIVPNVFGTILTLATIWLGNIIIIEASLGFLGIGTQPPHPSWGNMLSVEGRAYMQTAPWIGIVPGIAISLTVLASNMLGDSLRTFFDPKARRVVQERSRE